MATKSGFKYASDRDAIEEALADMGGGNFLKLKEGKNVIRILPPFDDSGLWFYESFLHYGFKRDGKTIAVPCTGEDCFICKKLNELSAEGAEGAKVAKRYGTRPKFYANALDRDAGGGVKIWGFSKKVLLQLKSYWMDVDDGCQFDDPLEGRDVIIERTGKGLDTRYEVRIRPKSTPAVPQGEDTPELINLREEVEKEFTKGDLKAIWAETFEGAEPGEDKETDDVEDDEEEEKSSKVSKKEADDDDDDEEEETPKKKSSKVVEDDDDDEEEEAPKKSSKKAVKEDDDDDEEEEAPKKKLKNRGRR